MDFSHAMMRTEEQMLGEANVGAYEGRVEPPQFGYDVQADEDSLRLGDDDSRIEDTPFSSDYYRELAYVTRGVTLPGIMESEGSYGSPAEMDKYGGPFKTAARSEDNVPFGGFAVTSVYLGRADVQGVLDCMEQLFSQKLAGEVLKKKLEKGTMKARVCHRAGHWAAHCTIKVRLYPNCPAAAVDQHAAPEERGLVAEFQRREGDALAFQAVFQKSKDYLELAAMSGFTALPSPPPPPPSAVVAPKADTKIVLEEGDEAVSGEDLQPALDLLHENEQQPSLQVEAINALLTVTMMSTAMETTICVCHALHSLQGVLESALASPAIEVAFPAVQLAESLPSEHCSDDFAASMRAARENCQNSWPCCQAMIP